jgi:hypothetical protein
LTTEHVWDGFVLLALLEDCQRRSAALNIPHTGAQKDRFTAAIHVRNLRFRVHGQPELRHFCDKCLRVYGDGKMVWVVVIDGVTVGHPCCARHNCKVPLANNKHRFCPEDAGQNTICAIIGCSSPTVPDSRVCSDLTHQEVERVHRERGQGRFQLKERLQRARVSHPNDAVAKETNVTEIIDTDNEEEDFEVDDPQEQENNGKSKKQLRAQFGRKRTHNEQIVVAPCGTIIARETFYGAEGVGSVVVSTFECCACYRSSDTVKEMIKRTFHEDIKPDHIFFDNNCTLAKLVTNDPFFKSIGLTVDVFHFKSKHAISDTFCQQHCNPAAYPELLSEDDKGWYFNSSIAEQTNVWLGGIMQYVVRC